MHILTYASNVCSVCSFRSIQSRDDHYHGRSRSHERHHSHSGYYDPYSFDDPLMFHSRSRSHSAAHSPHQLVHTGVPYATSSAIPIPGAMVPSVYHGSPGASSYASSSYHVPMGGYSYPQPHYGQQPVIAIPRHRSSSVSMPMPMAYPASAGVPMVISTSGRKHKHRHSHSSSRRSRSSDPTLRIEYPGSGYAGSGY
jgi:hypothetical protein